MKRLVYLLIFPIFLTLVFASCSLLQCCPKMQATEMPATAPVVKETPPPAPEPARMMEPMEEKG